ncbi:MAG TPA: transcription antitermination factor NusB [Trichocoleus sp.]
MQARRIGRELALLGMSQLPDKLEKLQRQDLEGLISAAVRTLTVEAKDALETAADELKRSSNRLVDSETLTTDVDSARVMVEDAIALTQNAINRLGGALELPEFVQITNQAEVRAFAMEILTNTIRYLKDVDKILDEAMVAWQLKRLARIDRDILRTAVVEMQYLGTPDRVAINEAVELAKRYSGEDGFRFINGVLRRVVEHDKGLEEGAEPSVVTPQGE